MIREKREKPGKCHSHGAAKGWSLEPSRAGFDTLSDTLNNLGPLSFMHSYNVGVLIDVRTKK